MTTTETTVQHSVHCDQHLVAATLVIDGPDGTKSARFTFTASSASEADKQFKAKLKGLSEKGFCTKALKEKWAELQSEA